MSKRKVITFIITLLITTFVFLPLNIIERPVTVSSAEAPIGIESTYGVEAEVPEPEVETNAFIEEKEAAAVMEPEALPEEPVDLTHYYIPWADIKISLEEFKLLCRTTYCEAGDQSLEAQKLVAMVILFRILDEDFPDNLHDVVYQDNGVQFNVVRRSDFDYVDFRQGADLTETACFLAIATYPEDPFDTVYFASGGYHTGSFAKDYKQIGDMYFSRKAEK